MATFTVVSNVGQSSELLFPTGGLAGITGRGGDSTERFITTASGQYLRYTGTGLTFSGFTPTGGTYTSIAILGGSGTVLATLSGFGSANFVDIINNPIATLLAGADVMTGGTGDDFLSGYGGNDTINGGDGNDTISGGFDFDSLDGGVGTDTGDFTFYNGAVQWNMATGAITFSPAGGTESAVNFENAIMGNGDDSITGSGLDNSLVGNGGADTLIGAGGADTLDGGSGNDSLVGGSGNDVYVVDATTDIVSEAAGDAADEVLTTLALFTLGTTAGSANVERLTFIGAGGFRGEGSAADNVITGGTGDDELIGFAGADTLIGAGGNDTFTYFAAGDITGDSIDGGADAGGFRDSIQVAFGGTADFSGATIASTGGNTSIEYLRLSTGVAHDVIFNGSQFGGGGLSASLTIQGDVDVDTVTINNVGGTLNLASLQFINWTAGQDRLIVNATSQTFFTGASVAEEYNGSAVIDLIFGSTGADTLRGGDGRDGFIYTNPDQVAGDVIDGGANLIDSLDNISLKYEGTADFGLATIASTATTSIEQLFFDNQTPGNSGTTAIFRASQFGPTGLATNLALQDNSTGPATLSITDISGAFDVNAFNFGSWKGTNKIVLTVDGVGSVLTGSAVREEFNGGTNADTMRGGEGADTLNGNAGADVFRYLSAAEITGDLIDGGLGSDTLQVEFTGAADFTTATIFSNVGPSIEALVLSGGGAHDVTFNASDFDGVNRLSTSLAVTGDNAGADTITINNAGFLFNLSALNLQGWQAQDRIVVNSNAGGSEVTGTAFSDVINGAAGNDTMYGTLGADAFRGAGGNDDFTYTSNAQLAGDTIDGGADAGGNGDVLRVNFAGLADFRAATILSTGQSSIEILRIGGGDHEIRFNGNQFGGNGLASTMRVQGNSGTDSLHFDNVTGSIDLSAVGFAVWTAGTDLVTITGVAGGQTITGSTQNDSIDGGAGSDTLIGGSGDDLFSYTSSADIAGDSIDGGASSGAGNQDSIEIKFTGAADFSSATFRSTGGNTSIERIALFGNGHDLIFNAAQFGPSGISGAVTIQGDAGSDSITINGVSGAFTASGFGFSSWDTAADRIVINGGTGADTITGTSQADIINGGAGADSLIGGDGNDVFLVDNSGDVVVEANASVSTGGYDIVYASANHTLSANIEQLELQSGATSGTGNTGANVISALGLLVGATLNGADGDDVLFGSNYLDSLVGGSGKDALLAGFSLNGFDTLVGGDGDDTFFTFELGDVIIEAAGAGTGTDTHYTQTNTVLAANVEQMIIYGGATLGTGNGGDNILFGTSSLVAQTLDGAGGNDVLYGSGQGDSLVGGLGNDALLGFAGTNTLVGGDGNDVYFSISGTDIVTEAAGGLSGVDTLYATYNVATLAANVEQLVIYNGATIGNGNSADNNLFGTSSSNAVTIDGAGGNDVIYGSTFDDLLVGGLGNDVLLSLGGNDRFAYAAAGNMGNDRIVDFDADPAGGGQDRIVLTGLGYTAASIGGNIIIAAPFIDALITFTGGSLAGTTITLTGIAVGNIDAGDFLF